MTTKMPKQTRRLLLRGIAVLFPILLLTISSAGVLNNDSKLSNATVPTSDDALGINNAANFNGSHIIDVHEMQTEVVSISISLDDQLVLEEELTEITRQYPYVLDTSQFIEGNYTITIIDHLGGMTMEQITI